MPGHSSAAIRSAAALLAAFVATATLDAQAPGSPRPIDACRRSLGDVRALWKAAAPSRGVAACRDRESLWLEIRHCFAGYGDWVPDLRDVGDCYVEAQDAEGARAFYRRAGDVVPSRLCTHDGWTCARAAAVELRLLDCGFDWLAADAETAWKGFVAAALDPDQALPADFHLEPIVDTDEPGVDAQLTCGAFRPGAPGATRAATLGVPAAILRSARAIADEVARSATEAVKRTVSVKLTDGELRGAMGRVDTSARYLRIQACPSRRPHLGPAGTRYSIELNLASAEERARPVCQSALAWVGRRVP